MMLIRQVPAAVMVFVVASMVALMAAAQSDPAVTQSDWLELVKGYRGDALGTEMRKIDSDSKDYNEITLAIPKASMGHPDTIEEVVVIGRKPEVSEPLLELEYEWLDDYDSDNYGLVIRLSKDSKWPIRLYMRSQEGYIR